MPGVVLMSGASSRRMAMRLFPFFATDRQKDRHGRMGVCMYTYTRVSAHTHRAISKKAKAIAIGKIDYSIIHGLFLLYST